MELAAKQPVRAEQTTAADMTRQQIRSSSFLLSGRGLTLGVNFATQVLMVRYLSTMDYGALAYALSVVAVFQSCMTLGLREAITRFVPIYHAQHEYGKLFGAICLAASTLALAAFVFIGAFFVLPEPMARFMSNEQQTLSLLAIMIFLVPFEAFDGLLIGLFASFGNPGAIFFRRYVLASGLRLGVVLLLIVWQRDVIFLAYGYLITTASGALISAGMLIRLLYRQKLFHHCALKTMEVPAREVFAFILPLLASHLLLTTMQTVNVVLLGYFHNMQEVALFRVVQPTADLNRTLMTSFTLFYMPAAARLFARNAYGELKELYVQTSIWMAVVSFPIFAVTFALAQPLVSWLYGPRYEPSGAILAVLSLGFYFHVTLGFNAMTLKALGKLRYLLAIDVLAVGVNVALNLLLIPRYGALGAAIGTAGAMIVHDILRQTGLYLALGLNIFDRQYGVFYLTIAGGTFALFLIQFFGASSHVAFLLVGLVTVGVLLLNRQKLHIAATFPELLRLPLLRLLFG